MGRVISIAAFFWASAHGQTGAMATVGVNIDSAAVEAEGTSAAAETAGAFMQPTAELVHRQYAPATLMVTRMGQRRIVPPLTATANVTNRSLLNFGSAKICVLIGAERYG